MLLLRVQVQSLNHTHSNFPTKDPVSFDFPTPSSPIYTHLMRYFQVNGWVLDISRITMFSVSWFARNTAIVIYNNYLNDNGSNNDNTRKTRILKSIKKKCSNTMLVEEKSISTCQKYKKNIFTHRHKNNLFCERDGIERCCEGIQFKIIILLFYFHLCTYCTVFVLSSR